MRPEKRSLHAFRDGRDSLQFSEFPIAILGDTAPREVKTIEFEDEITDFQTGKTLRRKVSVTGSDKFGLPTAKDEDVLLALIQLTKLANDFSNAEVRFTKREIIDLLDWPKTGWAYDRVEESLHRWKGVSIHHWNSWRDHKNKSWKNSAAMGVIEYTEIETHSADAKSASERGETRSSIVWNRKLFESFSSGYIKKIDFGIYRSLKRPAAKRAYRFLDKRFWHSPHWEFDLHSFACEKLGLSRAYSTGQLKERLKPALDELHDIGFIEPARYKKLKPKMWTVAFSKREPAEGVSRVAEGEHELVRELVAREVEVETARKLVGEFSEPAIREKLVLFDELVSSQDKRVERNPPGFLISAIKRDFKPSRRDVKRLERRASRLKPAKPKAAGKDLTGDASALEARLSQLSKDEVALLSNQALAQATPFQVATYKRLESGKSRLFPEFQRQLVLGFLERSSDWQPTGSPSQDSVGGLRDVESEVAA